MELEKGLSRQPDLDSSTDDYARRFAGPLGQWLLGVQNDATRRCLAGAPPGEVLDVGGGHGQNLAALKHLGYSPSLFVSQGCQRTRIHLADPEGEIPVLEGNLQHLECAARSYPIVISYRILAHIQDWPAYIAELCRVADRRVIVDFPTRRSFNILSELLYSLKKGVEENTRPYRIFRESEIVAAFSQQGFEPSTRVAQFFWPMAVHRALKQPQVSQILERSADLVGLRSFFGSPVIAAFDRQEA